MKHSLLYLKKHPAQVFKVAAGVLLLLVLLLLALKITSATVRPILNQAGFGGMPGFAPSFTKDMYYGDGDESMAYQQEGRMALTDSSMPYPIPPIDTGYIAGDDSEEYEVTQYNGIIKSSDTEETCTVLADLTALPHVIAESRQKYDRGCSYSFKVEREKVQEVLDAVEALDPYELNAHTYTIKRDVEYVSRETAILEEKLASIDETLQNALEAYEDITAVATRSNDAESLATIIDSKLRMIERLTQERLNVSQQLDRFRTQASDQLDQLNYVSFHLTVQHDAFVDGKDIKESWKQAIKEFVREVNEILQEVSVGLLVLLLTIAQFVLYFFIVLVVAKVGWKAAKKIWRS